MLQSFQKSSAADAATCVCMFLIRFYVKDTKIGKVNTIIFGQIPLIDVLRNLDDAVKIADRVHRKEGVTNLNRQHI